MRASRSVKGRHPKPCTRAVKNIVYSTPGLRPLPTGREMIRQDLRDSTETDRDLAVQRNVGPGKTVEVVSLAILRSASGLEG